MSAPNVVLDGRLIEANVHINRMFSQDAEIEIEGFGQADMLPKWPTVCSLTVIDPKRGTVAIIGKIHITGFEWYDKDSWRIFALMIELSIL